ncbi:MAG: UDP-N-acetylmuramoyl-tripeptide--D-alanyl-D-alanine ligase [Longimicrobiales bacterium]
MTFRWTDPEVRMALGMNPLRARPELAYQRVWTDSRTVEAGDLFVALSGERFDGHDFVAEAVARGADGVVVSREVAVEEATRIYPVEDTLRALGFLARYRRRALRARVVGITGSSGKTTTKELLAGTLSGSFRIHATPRNLNNRIGLPQTILAAPDDAQLLVLEMGTNEPGEIRALTEVAEPEIGVITTVSETHLEKLGSLEGVLEEKLDLFRGLGLPGIGVVGDEPEILPARARSLVPQVRVAGWTDRATPEYRPSEAEISEKGCYRFRWMGEQVRMGLPGRHSVQNALLALAVAHSLGVPPKDATRRIGKVKAQRMRSEIRSLGSLTLLLDCYNANPQSVRAALDLLETIQVLGPRVAVLGSMLELGEDARLYHRRVPEEALSRAVDLIVATGLFAEAAKWVTPPPRGPELVAVHGLEAAGELLDSRLGGTEVVLLKASRGVAMESLVPALEERFGTPSARSGGTRDEGSTNPPSSRLPAGKEA